jgi:AcrR family transcriptional regulator
MGRWEPNARGRLERAALDLFTERGFEKVTVAEIAERAGLTERTFFRHFADKREVLFWGQGPMLDLMLDAMRHAPDAATPVELVGAALDVFGTTVDERGPEAARRRQAIIAANPELQERERTKLASWGAAIAKALREHGTPDPAASLAGEAAIAVLHVTWVTWISSDSPGPLRDLLGDSLAALQSVLTAGR